MDSGGAPQSVMDAIGYQPQRAHNELKQSLIQFLHSKPSFFHLTGESVILGPKAKVAQKMEHDVKVRYWRSLNQQITTSLFVGYLISLGQL